MKKRKQKTIKDLSCHFILKRNNIDIGSGDLPIFVVSDIKRLNHKLPLQFL
jgi:hypothetical protein